MKFSHYQELAGRTEKPLPTAVDRLVHAFMGLATEVGELGTPIKAAAIYNKPLLEVPEQVANLREELGDLLWYVALAANALGMNLDEIAEENIAKLRARYPDRYSDEAAQARADKATRDALLQDILNQQGPSSTVIVN